MDAPLPDFENPPVVEVALGVQFDPIAGLTVPQLGLLWDRCFRKDFPNSEEHAPLESTIERFGISGLGNGGVRIQMANRPPSPRVWFLSNDGSELIQVQPDRFTHNWRKGGRSVEYPRYDHIRREFSEEISKFEKHIEAEGLGKVTPNQCEVTYVNHISTNEEWQTHAEMGNVIALCKPEFSEEFLPEPEELHMKGSFVIPHDDGTPLGRLRFSMEPAFRRSDNAPVFLLNLVARGRPTNEGLAGVLGFMDIGRKWIVRGFAALTTPKMHAVWRRIR